MIVPILLLLASLAGIAAALTQLGLADLLLVAVPSAIASLYLLITVARRSRASGPAPKWIMVDGSNVLHWKDGTPRLDSLREVLQHLAALGYAPGVVFDANAGYLLTDRYQHDGALAKLLGLPADRVMVVDKGTPADPVLLAAARDLGAGIVTNDRYRDWAATHPEVGTPGHLIRGGYRAGQLWLDLGQTAAITKP